VTLEPTPARLVRLLAATAMHRLVAAPRDLVDHPEQLANQGNMAHPVGQVNPAELPFLHLQGPSQQNAKPAHLDPLAHKAHKDRKENQETQDLSDHLVSPETVDLLVLPDHKDPREGPAHKETRDHKVRRETMDFVDRRETRDPKGPLDLRERRDHRDHVETMENAETTEFKDHLALKDHKAPRATMGIPAAKDPRESPERMCTTAHALAALALAWCLCGSKRHD